MICEIYLFSIGLISDILDKGRRVKEKILYYQKRSTMTNDEFRGKYTKSNAVESFLVNNFYRNLKEMVKGSDIKTILEVGCGHGYSTKRLFEIFPESLIEASDHDLALVEDAKRMNPEIKITQESIYDLKRPDNSFELVLALEVLEHLESPDQAMAELHRVAKKYCLVSVPHEPIWRILNMTRGSYWKDWGNTPGHVKHWSRKTFVDFVNKYFKVIKVRNPMPWIVLLSKK